MDTSQILPYAAIAALAIMTPGADFAILLKHAGRRGRGAGLHAAAGVTTGFAIHALAAAAGVGALLLTSATAFTVVKLLGAVYLGYLGVRALISAARSTNSEHADAGNLVASAGRPYREALLVNVLNPKVVLTYLALMPQFLPADAAVFATVSMSAVTVAIAGVWFTILAVAFAGARAFLAKPRVQRAIDAVTGFVLVGLGVRLAAARQ